MLCACGAGRHGTSEPSVVVVSPVPVQVSSTRVTPAPGTNQPRPVRSAVGIQT